MTGELIKRIDHLYTQAGWARAERTLAGSEKAFELERQAFALLIDQISTAEILKIVDLNKEKSRPVVQTVTA